MSCLEKEKQRFRRFLLEKNIRQSKGRTVVLKEALAIHGHFSAEEMVKRCSFKKLPISRATIYRSLSLLKESGILRETAYGEKHQHYEYARADNHHHHARCIHCNKVIEFSCEERNLSSEKELLQNGFKIIGHELHFYGLCSACQKEG